MFCGGNTSLSPFSYENNENAMIDTSKRSAQQQQQQHQTLDNHQQTHGRYFGKELGNFAHMNKSSVGAIKHGGQHENHWPSSNPLTSLYDESLKSIPTHRRPGSAMVIENPKTGKSSVFEEDFERGRKQRAKPLEDHSTRMETHEVPATVMDEHMLYEPEDIKNPQCTTGYAKDIFIYLRSNEERFASKFGYIMRQQEINEKMRSILLDWLVDVHVKFKLRQETLFIAVNLIDRFCEKNLHVTRARYQLVGITALFIAAKYEEIYPPELKDFVYVTDNAYTKQDVLDMEGQIIAALEFNLLSVSPLYFIERFTKLSKLDTKFNHFVGFLAELCLIDYSMTKFPASQIACAAVYLANKLCNKADMNEKLLLLANYKETQIKPLVYELINLLNVTEKSTLQAVRRKYAQPLYSEVSRIRINLLDKRPH